MKKIKDNLKIILPLLIIVIVFVLEIFMSYKKISLQKYSNDMYSMKYDSSWKITSKSDYYMELEHHNNSSLLIEIKELDESQRYNDITLLIEQIESSIKNQNKSYSLIAKETTEITSKLISGYKLLFEDRETEALIYVFKENDKLVIITYQAQFNVFDMLLDSVHNIVYNFQINEIDVEYSYKILYPETTNISWSDKKDVSSTKTYEIASNNYLVNYEIPSQLKLSAFNSYYNYFSYYSDSKSITISTGIKSYNIYEYLLKKDFGSIEYEIESIKKNANNKNVIVQIQKTADGYIYKISYETYSEILKTSTNYEKIYKVYSLDYRRILVFEITTKDMSFSNDMIESIKLTKKEKIAKYIFRNEENGFLVNDLKMIIKNGNDKYYRAKVMLPLEFREIEKSNTNSNVYENRYFGFKAIDDEMFEYNVSYLLSGVYLNNDDKIINQIRDDYTESSAVYDGLITMNEKTFKSYSLEYQKNNLLFYEKILIYDIENGYFVIKLNRINRKYEDSVLSDVTKFEITLEETE